MSDGYEDPSLEDPTVQALQGHIGQLQRQLSNSMGMCQSLISDQQSMSNLLSGSLNGMFSYALNQVNQLKSYNLYYQDGNSLLCEIWVYIH